MRKSRGGGGNRAPWGSPGGVSGGRPGELGVCASLARAEVRLLPTTMAFYISQPKVRQAGFELPNKTDEERQPSPGAYIGPWVWSRPASDHACPAPPPHRPRLRPLDVLCPQQLWVAL